jgi:methyl-accepting chemotaxis protein
MGQAVDYFMKTARTGGVVTVLLLRDAVAELATRIELIEHTMVDVGQAVDELSATIQECAAMTREIRATILKGKSNG